MTYTPTKWVNGGKPAINAENLNKIEKALAQLSVPDITTTTSTTQPNSYAGREMVLEIGGVTEQGENPSPTSPQEIKKSKVKGVRTHNEQLWNGKYVTNALNKEQDNFVDGSTMAGNIAMPVEVGKQYTLSINGSLAVMRYAFLDSDGNTVTSLTNATTTIVAPENAVYMKWRVYNYHAESDKCMLNEGTTALPYEPYTSSEYTFSQPIELYGKDGVQDVIVQKEIERKYATKQITSVIDFDSSGKLFRIGEFNDIIYDGTDGLPADILCDSYITYELGKARTVDYGFTQYGKGLYIANKDWNYNLDTANTALAQKPITVVYKLETPTTEALPIADQIGLNSLATYDGITYVEFIYEGPQPTLKAEYGTSKVGGYTLEAMLAGRNGELRGV